MPDIPITWEKVGTLDYSTSSAVSSVSFSVTITNKCVTNQVNTDNMVLLLLIGTKRRSGIGSGMVTGVSITSPEPRTMTKMGSAHASPKETTIFALHRPPLGTVTGTITFSTSIDYIVQPVIVYDVHGTAPFIDCRVGSSYSSTSKDRFIFAQGLPGARAFYIEAADQTNASPAIVFTPKGAAQEVVPATYFGNTVNSNAWWGAVTQTLAGDAHVGSDITQDDGGTTSAVGMALTLRRAVPLDTALVSMVTGTYIGDGTTDDSHVINLPLSADNLWTPRMVIVKGLTSGGTDTYGSPMIRTDTMSVSRDVRSVNKEDQGIKALGAGTFTVRHVVTTNSGRTNESGVEYHYWAIGGDAVSTGIYTITGHEAWPIDITGLLDANENPIVEPVAMVIGIPVGTGSASGFRMAQSGRWGQWIDASYKECQSFDGTIGSDFLIDILASGFTLDSYVGTSGIKIHYLAIPMSGNFHVGSYDDSYDAYSTKVIPTASQSSQAIGSLGSPVPPFQFKPDIVFIKARNVSASTTIIRGSDLGNPVTGEPDGVPYGKALHGGGSANALVVDAIPTIGVDTFTKGTQHDVGSTNWHCEYFVLGGTAPPDGPPPPVTPPDGKRFAGSTADAYVQISNLLLKATPERVVSSEIIGQMIAGSDDIARQAPQLSSDLSFVTPSGNTVEMRKAIFAATTVQEIINNLAATSDATVSRAWFGAVWDGRRLYFGPRITDQVKWYITKANLGDAGISLERGLQGFWSVVQSFYVDGNDIVQSVPPISDPAFKDGVPVERWQTLDLGSLPLTTEARDAYLEDFKIAQPSTELEIRGWVQNAAGVDEPLWRVRAGDVIQIVDLLPGRYFRLSDAIDPLRTFFIRETTYDASTGVLNIAPAWPAERLDTLIANAQQIMGT